MGQTPKATGHMKRNQNSNCTVQRMMLFRQLVMMGGAAELSYK